MTYTPKDMAIGIVEEWEHECAYYVPDKYVTSLVNAIAEQVDALQQAQDEIKRLTVENKRLDMEASKLWQAIRIRTEDQR